MAYVVALLQMYILSDEVSNNSVFRILIIIVMIYVLSWSFDVIRMQISAIPIIILKIFN